MSFYLIPIVSSTIGTGPGAQTVLIPEYMLALNQPFSCIPFGVEGVGLVSTQENATLDSAPDVFSFPSDLTQTLAPVIVSTTMAFNNLNPNIPTSWMTSGMTFGQVLRQIAQIFLCVQMAEGPAGTNGASVFVQLAGNNSTPSAALQALPAGVFDFTQANSSDSVSDTLVAISQQFTDPIQMGQGAI
jgi:hypothetical protein